MRTGDLSLRGQPLNSHLLDVLKRDELDIKLSINSDAVAPPTTTTEDFIDISTRVTNHLGRPLRLRITLEPLASPDGKTRQNPAALKNLLIDGNRSKTISALETGSDEIHTVSVVFMAKGAYAFRAVVQELLDTQGQEGLTKFSSVLSVHVG